MNHHKCFWAMIVLGIFTATARAETVDQFGWLEQRFQAEDDYANPYTELAPVAEVTGPNGAMRKMPLFWDGGREWVLRFSPDDVGTWVFKIRSEDSGINGQAGEFACRRSQLPGGLQPMREHSHHFQRQNGAPFLFWGDTAWGLYLDNDEEQLDRQAVFHYIDERAQQGINVIHSMMLSEAGWGNAGGPAFEDLQAETLNPAYWQEVDVRLRYLNERGIVGGLVLAWAFKGSNPLSWQDVPSMEARKRYIRYIAARYGAYDTYFILAGEWNLRARNDAEQLEKLRKEYDEMGQWLAEFNGCRRMIGIHPGFGTTREWDAKAWTSFGDYQQNYPRVHDEIIKSQEVRGPIVNSEYGYLYRDMTSDGIVDKHNSFGSEDMRFATWDIVMGGGYPVTGYASTYMGGYRDVGPFNVDEPKNDEWERQYHLIQRILGGLDWWKLQPQDGAIHAEAARSDDRIKTVPYRDGRTRDAWRPPLIAYWLLNEPGWHYVAYARGVSDEIRIDLGDKGEGEYRARLFNPRDGSMQPVGDKIDLQAEYRWTPPDDNDWVLHLINLTATSAGKHGERPSPGDINSPWEAPQVKLSETISLTEKQAGPGERLRIVRGGKFTGEGWQPTDRLDRLVIELAHGFEHNQPGAIELDMSELDFDAQVDGRKQHFLSLYADPTGDQFNLRNAFLTLRAGRYFNDRRHRGIKVLWRGDTIRGEHAPYAARPQWDRRAVYTWRAEWDQENLVVLLNGERVFGPAEFGDRDIARPMAHIFLSRDGCLNENIWFGFPGPVYREIRIFRE